MRQCVPLNVVVCCLVPMQLQSPFPGCHTAEPKLDLVQSVLQFNTTHQVVVRLKASILSFSCGHPIWNLEKEAWNCVSSSFLLLKAQKHVRREQ